jgi:hypothetical protein
MTGDRVEKTHTDKKKAAPSLAVFAAAAVLPRHGSWKSTPKVSVDFNSCRPGDAQPPQSTFTPFTEKQKKRHLCSPSETRRYIRAPLSLERVLTEVKRSTP